MRHSLPNFLNWTPGTQEGTYLTEVPVSTQDREGESQAYGSGGGLQGTLPAL